MESVHRNSHGIASSLFSSAQSLGSGLFLLHSYQPDNSVSVPAAVLVYFEDRWRRPVA
jgi:hypothetical protein